MKIKEVVNAIEQHAPLAYAETWDNAGLLVGDDNKEVLGVLIALDFTEEILQEAIEKKCNLIITHHPLIFKGLTKIDNHSAIGRMVLTAIAHNIAVYAAHTNLDNAIEGVNAYLAGKIGLTNTKILAPQINRMMKLVVFVPEKYAETVGDALYAAGAGSIGNYDSCGFSTAGTGTFRANDKANPFVGERGKVHKEKEIRIETVFPEFLQHQIVSAMFNAHPYEVPAYDLYLLQNTYTQAGSGIIGSLQEAVDEIDFLRQLKTVLKIPAIRHSNFTGKKIKTVALCGGAGSFLINNAIAQKADVFVTADLKYHEFFIPNKNILLVDAGHYETEQFTTLLIKDILNKNFSNFAIHISHISTNAVNYLI
jgi:dinuclear metal center YbgI/SA1388 family protein